MHQEEEIPCPCYDPEVLPARECFEDAFWELSAGHGCCKIIVTSVVCEAGADRSLFYHHFSGLPELADSIILRQAELILINHTPDPNDNPKERW